MARRKMSTKQRAAALKNLAKARRARRKPKSSSHKAHRKSRRKARKAARAKHRRALKHSGRIRPVVIVSGGKYHRPKRSKYFSRPTRINRRRRARHNPGFSGSVKSIFKMSTLKRVLAVGGGILTGTFVSKFLSTGMLPGVSTPILPASVTSVLAKARPVHGVFHLIVGFYLQKQRNPIVKDLGMGVAALGGFDLLTQVLSLAGVKNLPTFSGMNVNLLGMNVNPQKPAIVLQGESPSYSMADDLVAI